MKKSSKRNRSHIICPAGNVAFFVWKGSVKLEGNIVNHPIRGAENEAGR